MPGAAATGPLTCLVCVQAAAAAAPAEEASNIVVLVPGARTLLYGLTTEALPRTVAHCLAWRRSGDPLRLPAEVSAKTNGDDDDDVDAEEENDD